MTRGARRLPPLVLGTFGLLGCAAFVLAFTYRHNLRVDLTPGRTYTLSAHARGILERLERPVRITAFVRSEDPRTPLMKDLLWRVGAVTPQISYEFVDLNRSPALARRYGVERYGALVVESEGRRQDVGNPSEGLLMSALLAVTRDRERIVYFLVGHGEHAPTDTDRVRGYSTVTRALEDDLFDVRELSLLGPGGVPADAMLLVIAGPRKDLLPHEQQGLERYLAGGGNLLLLLEPETPPTFTALARRRGVTATDQIVVDPRERLASGEGVTFKVADLDARFLVSGTLEAAPVLSYARALATADESALAFLTTSPQSYTLARGGVPERAPAGPTGPVSVGVAVRGEGGEDGAGGGRLIVLGDADFASNRFVDYLGNKDLFVNSANWLVREESLIAARAQAKEAGREQFFVTEEQGAIAFWLAAVAQPAVFLVAGIVVFARRRSR